MVLQIRVENEDLVSWRCSAGGERQLMPMISLASPDADHVRTARRRGLLDQRHAILEPSSMSTILIVGIGAEAQAA